MYRRLSEAKEAKEAIVICPSFSIAHDKDSGRDDSY